MESTYTDLALYGGKNLCARTDNGFSPISEVFDGMVSLSEMSQTPVGRSKPVLGRVTLHTSSSKQKKLHEKETHILTSQLYERIGQGPIL